jgi:hypothetical protein
MGRISAAVLAASLATPAAGGDFALLDRTDVGGRFEAFATLQNRSVRAWINEGSSVANVGTKAVPVWWTSPATPGVLLVDRVNGPVAYLFKLLTFGIMSVPKSGYDYQGRLVTVSGSPDPSVLATVIPASTLEFVWGPEMRGGTVSGSNGRWLGMTFGYLQFPGWKGIDDVTALDPLSRRSGVRFLRKEGAYWATSSYASEKIAAVNVRLPLNLPLLGGISVVWDLPMVYTVMAVLGPTVGYGKDEGFSDDWGVPRVKVQASRSLGPVGVGAEYVIPARYLVVPYYRQGAHFAVHAGLRF